MHQPVLYHEIIHSLSPRSGHRIVDCTVGAGGHAQGLLDASSPDGYLLGFDVDPQALRLASELLSRFPGRATLVCDNYVTLPVQLKNLNWESVNSILIDLGASSMQFDNPERGFSFQKDGLLDMRFDPNLSISAADLVNDLSERQLSDLIYNYGEERESRRISRAIIQSRPINSTLELGKVIERTVRSRSSGIHPATRTFQALRIAVNHELEILEQVLPLAISALAPGGRMAVIAFHSLEDRIVKRFFTKEAQKCICPPRQPVCTCEHRAEIRLVTHHPIRPGAQEIFTNPRARSARLRVVEKLIDL